MHISIRCDAATGFGGRAETEDCGFLPNFPDVVPRIAEERVVAFPHADMGDVARKVALEIYLMSRVRRLDVDLSHFLYLAVGGWLGGRGVGPLLCFREGFLGRYKLGGVREVWGVGRSCDSAIALLREIEGRPANYRRPRALLNGALDIYNYAKVAYVEAREKTARRDRRT